MFIFVFGVVFLLLGGASWLNLYNTGFLNIYSLESWNFAIVTVLSNPSYIFEIPRTSISIILGYISFPISSFLFMLAFFLRKKKAPVINIKVPKKTKRKTEKPVSDNFSSSKNQKYKEENYQDEIPSYRESISRAPIPSYNKEESEEKAPSKFSFSFVTKAITSLGGVISSLKKPKVEENTQDVVQDNLSEDEEKDSYQTDGITRAMEWYGTWRVIRSGDKPARLITEAEEIIASLPKNAQEILTQKHGIKGATAYANLLDAVGKIAPKINVPKTSEVEERYEEKRPSREESDFSPVEIEDDISSSISPQFDRKPPERIIKRPVSDDLNLDIADDLSISEVMSSTVMPVDKEKTRDIYTSSVVDIPTTGFDDNETKLDESDIEISDQVTKTELPEGDLSAGIEGEEIKHVYEGTIIENNLEVRQEISENIRSMYKEMAKQSDIDVFNPVIWRVRDEKGKRLNKELEMLVGPWSRGSRYGAKGQEGVVIFTFIYVPEGSWKLKPAEGLFGKDKWVLNSADGLSYVRLRDGEIESLKKTNKEEESSKNLRVHGIIHLMVDNEEDTQIIGLEEPLPGLTLRVGEMSPDEWKNMIKNHIVEKTIFD